MVYLLQKIFRPRRREEAEQLLQRRSATPTSRACSCLQRGNAGWLSFHMFTFFTDRDGKMQLESLAAVSFDPLSTHLRFMLTEEAHTCSFGETGIGRTLQRNAASDEGCRHEDVNDSRKRCARSASSTSPDEEEAQPALHAFARPVRLGGLDQRRQRLQCRHQGRLPGDQDRG